MDEGIIAESNNLLTAVADTCNPSNPLFCDRTAIENIAGAELSIIRLVHAYDALSAAKLSFGLGVYLGLQYQQLKSIVR